MRTAIFTSVTALLACMFFFKTDNAFCQSSDIPWSSAADAKSYIIIGQDLWNIHTGQLAGKGWSQYCSALQFPRAVMNAPGRFFCESKPPSFGFAAQWARFSIPYEKAKILLKYGDTTHKGDVYLSSDYRRVVYVENGDIWRADFDWIGGQLVNKTKVTSIGLFSGKKLLLWYGNLLFLATNFSKEKPIARIDLATGNIDEIGDSYVFNPRVGGNVPGFVNPSAYRVVRPDRNILRSYDARTGRVSELSTELITPGSKFIWLDDDNAVAESLTGVLVYINFNNNSTNVFRGKNTGHRRDDTVLKIQSVLPGKQYVDVAELTSGYADSSMQNEARFLLNPRTGTRINLTIEPDSYGIWLDDNKFLFGKKTGGLNEIGTWAYDRSTGQNTKIAQIPAGINYGEASALYIPDKNIVYFSSWEGGANIYRVGLDGSGFTRVTSFSSGHNGGIGRVNMNPINLGIGSSNASLWQQSTYGSQTDSYSAPEEEYTHPAAGQEEEQYGEQPPQNPDDDLSTVNEQLKKTRDTVKDLGDTIKEFKNIFE